MRRRTSPSAGSSDLIRVRQLAVDCVIGTYPHERTQTQTIYLDLDIPCDATRPARRDDLSLAVDYDRLTRRVRAFADGTKFFLIETLAERLAAALLKEFGLAWVRLTIWKPGALKRCGNLGISITRKKETKRR